MSQVKALGELGPQALTAGLGGLCLDCRPVPLQM